MEFRAVEKYIRISPKKARLVADVVRGQSAVTAMNQLKFMPKKAAGIIYKALFSAISNAENNAGIKKENLVISKITIDQGPSLKRFRPRSKGMASALLKRTSHITVVVSGEGEIKKAVKTDKVAVEPKKAAKAVTQKPKATEAVEGSK